jgi:salicylate hydroxylase
MVHPGLLAEGKTKETLDLEEMRNRFKSFDRRIQKILSLVKTGFKWQLGSLPPLPRWMSRSGRVVLIGDAAYVMLPFLAQVSDARTVIFEPRT